MPFWWQMSARMSRASAGTAGSKIKPNQTQIMWFMRVAHSINKKSPFLQPSRWKPIPSMVCPAVFGMCMNFRHRCRCVELMVFTSSCVSKCSIKNNGDKIDILTAKGHHMQATKNMPAQKIMKPRLDMHLARVSLTMLSSICPGNMSRMTEHVARKSTGVLVSQDVSWFSRWNIFSDETC